MATEGQVVHSALAGTTVQLVALDQLHSGEIEQAIRTLDWDIDRRAVFLDSVLSHDSVSDSDVPVVSCHLNRIKKYRAEYPFTHSDVEFGELVATALARPASCPKSSQEPDSQVAAVSAGG
jgi:hypothetical protein